MTVTDLIARLQEIDGDLVIVVPRESHGLLVAGYREAKYARIMSATDIGWDNYLSRDDGEVSVVEIS